MRTTHLARLPTALLATTVLLAPSAAAAKPAVPPKPDRIPQIMWNVFWDQDDFKEADRDYYINSHGPMSDDAYMFRTTNHYKVTCDASGRRPGHGIQIIMCYGKLPLAGSRKYIPLSPLKSTKLPTMMQGVGLGKEPSDTEMYPDNGDPFNAYGYPIKVLPIGQKLIFSKEDPSWFEYGAGTYYGKYPEKYNRKLVCVVPDKYSFGCIRSDNHGFYFDLYGSHLF